MFGLLLLSSGIFWTITYLLIIRKGYQDQTYGMPVAALCFYNPIYPISLQKLRVNAQAFYW